MILAAVCLGMSAWFAYDGFIGYPAKLERSEAFAQLGDLPGRQLEDRWTEIAEENGWSKRRPEKSPEEIEGDIREQYFWSALTLLLGIPALYFLVRSRGSWVERTGDGIATSWGQAFKFADVTNLNKRRWERKGIAVAAYTDAGEGKTFTFDDFKFEREPLGKMLRDLESHLADEQITGGLSEVAADARRAEEKAVEEEAAQESKED
ncbi:MAG TPA: hypothetical protein DDW52_17535 [Planctomycetaceae bacterium]|nr:hypothetical protein [Planctomycetaceae bacterium]